MFSLEQLEAFVTTVEKGSFSAAARALGKAQSAVSQHVLNLEIDCQCDLFDRSGRYPVLTDSGHNLVAHAKAVLQQHKRLQHQALHLTMHGHSTLVLAIDEGIPLAGITAQLGVLAAKYPQLSIECLSAASTDIIDMVSSGRATTGVIFSEQALPSDIDFENLGALTFDVFVSSHHPLAQSTAMHIDMLKLHRQLLISARNAKQSTFHQAHSPDIWHADNYFMLLALTVSGFGWSFLPTHIAQDDLAAGRIVKLPIEFEELRWHVNVDIIQHQNCSTDPMHKRIRQLFATILQ
ncbi:LysR family transcriptional regulator [Shewanella sp. OMA3-2]|uniref:LysR family transcriptional regulator n=1 Tax=Shewanella sp. OMA3-2 TaxID=2908650 RepID=UPI001F2E8A83|nr:LysR family transcriptional regulator [Shewanella sp. OMA3-2]UJF22396.1 LysR family transcriptional regulator [Shewanella sp. OMA3-2]